MNIQKAFDYLEGARFANEGGRILAERGDSRYVACDLHCYCCEIRNEDAKMYGDALAALLNGAKDAHERAARLEEAADLAIRGFQRWKRNQKRGGSRVEADHGLDDLGQAVSDLDALLHPVPEEASAT